MALRALQTPQSKLSTFFHISRPTVRTTPLLRWGSRALVLPQQRRPRRSVAVACVKLEDEEKVSEKTGSEWGKVSAVLFDMDGVLCDSEEPSRRAAVDVFAEMGVQVTVDDFVPFMGTGEANFLGGVASVKGVEGFNPEAAKKRFFEIYLNKYAKPNSGIGFPGALELITQCKRKGLKVAVASSADRIKVDANLAAAGLPLSMFDAIVSADAFENLKPAPDIFLAASKILNVPISECIVIEDALAGVQAAKAAQMRCIAVTTTLAEETLKTASPALIRQDIGSVSVDDILCGGSSCHNEKMQGSHLPNSSGQTSAALLVDVTASRPIMGINSANNEVFSIGGLQGSRRDIVRYGSLGIAISCLVFTITNWKAMQYASPKAVWNSLFGVSNSPSFGQNEGADLCGSGSARVQQFVNYISDLETRGTASIVPEFPSKLDWLNTAPLKLNRDLKGKVVLLDFWTYCCINCMHVLPDLEFLEKKYKDMPFTVVGVHSAKFDNEKDLEAIRNAILRYGITHPVVNDGDMSLWRELGVNSWPTFVIVGPNGKLLAQISGEGRRKGLAYDAKKNLLYVADTENHALRVINFVDEMVGTLAGNGTKGSDYKGGGRGTTQLLNSPWDVCFEPVNEVVYIAMAGQHQIWEHNTLDGVTRAFSGDGYERNLNGSSSTSTSFAQPSGISLSPDLKEAYIADSESSSIRALDLKTGGSRLLAGGDPFFAENLFKFGDHDGAGSEVLLQHPLGVLCGRDGQIYIADSYNHKIKKLDPASKRVSTVAGTGKAGLKDGMAQVAQLSEPSGIIEAQNGRLFIADTNNSVIRHLDLNKEEPELLTLELKGVQPPIPKSRSLKRLRRRSSADTDTVKVDGSSSIEGNLYLKISVPEGYHFSKEARSKFSVEIEPENQVVINPVDGYLSLEGFASLHFRRSSPSASMGRINCKVYYCKEDEVCLYQSLSFEVPFQEVIPDSKPAEIALTYLVKPKTSTGSLQLPVAR
ncbi:protein SUPPRESSOR OF QUENCHING 1, chloroplastic isoform X6 [Rhododendron vialii]|uniref:protein SUPPRESSOR OF QUENCHING 1, chloroplastic isoform X6 n=1 Tax=Rhododendron vialii TaxID=182163 RepID=UPI00265FC263|nr:protein SUPPRESSOR OF QUENCHING 1, chloroplastic isoform X6 [Rhododendron vialii]